MKLFRQLFVSILFISIVFVSCNSKPIVIATIGDSITAGAKHKKQSETAYPKVLGDVLGDDYHVVNCGRSGATALKSGNLPYWNCNEFSNVFALHPDIVTIKLGTNDSKPYNWNELAYKESYQALIDTLLTMNPKPKIYLCLPVPVFPHNKFKIRGDVVNNEIVPIIKLKGKENNLEIIDLYNPFLGKDELLPDGVHPEEEGAALIAKLIAEKIKK